MVYVRIVKSSIKGTVHWYCLCVLTCNLTACFIMQVYKINKYTLYHNGGFFLVMRFFWYFLVIAGYPLKLIPVSFSKIQTIRLSSTSHILLSHSFTFDLRCKSAAHNYYGDPAIVYTYGLKIEFFN